MFSAGEKERLHNTPDQDAGKKGHYPGLTKAFAKFSIETFLCHMGCFFFARSLHEIFRFYSLQIGPTAPGVSRYLSRGHMEHGK